LAPARAVPLYARKVGIHLVIAFVFGARSGRTSALAAQERTKHSSAEHARFIARLESRTLEVQIRDDGVGGARPGGSGLVVLADRLASIDGRVQIESPAGGGTLVVAQIPVAA
jgi:glucose-6-phosphate-specific signal transduction histidine kinase